jgi:dTMP kinase
VESRILTERARFIALEGGEGVGKSTLMRGLVAWLSQKGIEVVQTREPGGTPIADQIRKIFKAPPEGDEITSETEALLVSAARAQHVAKVIRPALANGQWVVCDRFSDSTRVYQGLFGGVALNDLEWLIRFSTGGIEPDITFLLDCDVAVTSHRIGGRGTSMNDDDTARYDQGGQLVLDRLRQGYRKVAGFYPARFYILDAARSADEVLHDACAELERRWNL